MASTGTPPGEIIATRGLTQISDETSLRVIIQEALSAHPNQVAAYRKGKTNLAAFFVGKVMQATHGQANPQLANALVKELLEQ